MNLWINGCKNKQKIENYTYLKNNSDTNFIKSINEYLFGNNRMTLSKILNYTAILHDKINNMEKVKRDIYKHNDKKIYLWKNELVYHASDDLIDFSRDGNDFKKLHHQNVTNNFPVILSLLIEDKAKDDDFLITVFDITNIEDKPQDDNNLFLSDYQVK